MPPLRGGGITGRLHQIPSLLQVADSYGQEQWPSGYRLPAKAQAFSTRVGGDLRTCGIAVGRPGRRAVDLEGLDLDRLSAAAAGVPEAAARGKMVTLGEDGVAVFQTKPGVRPELAWCGNGASVATLFLGCIDAAFDLFGPDGGIARVVQSLAGTSVQQVWTIPVFTMAETEWLGHPVARCSGLNAYAVIAGALPDGVTPEEARQALVGAGLASKLAVVTTSASGVPHVAFFNAHGLHGAAPTTGITTIAILARLSPLFGGLFCDGVVSYDTKAGVVEAPLPDVLVEPAGAITVVMPTVDVRLSALDGETGQ